MATPLTPLAAALPRLLWGAALANTLEVGAPFQQVATYPQPRDGLTIQARRSSAERDVVSAGVDFCLDVVVRGIPGAALGTGLYGVPVAGWDGATGWRAFLQWAMHPRHRCVLVPERSLPTLQWTVRLAKPALDDAPGEADPYRYTRQLALTFVNADGLPFTGY